MKYKRHSFIISTALTHKTDTAGICATILK